MTIRVVAGASSPPGWPGPGVPPFLPPERPSPATPPVYPPVPVVYEPAAPSSQIADRLLDRRMVLVSGTLDVPAANDASARLMLLDGTGDDPIELVMSCPDADLVAATALADTVELVGVEVRALCSGVVGGPSVLPFALATRRLAQPHATLRLSNPRYETTGRASELATEAERHAELLGELHRRVAAATHHGFDEVVEDFARNRLLSATEATAYGLVDEILRRGGLTAV